MKQAVRGIHYTDKENEVTIDFNYRANVQCPTLSPLRIPAKQPCKLEPRLIMKNFQV
jgi:hypothetical protein